MAAMMSLQNLFIYGIRYGYVNTHRTTTSLHTATPYTSAGDAVYLLCAAARQPAGWRSTYTIVALRASLLPVPP